MDQRQLNIRFNLTFSSFKQTAPRACWPLHTPAPWLGPDPGDGRLRAEMPAIDSGVRRQDHVQSGPGLTHRYNIDAEAGLELVQWLAQSPPLCGPRSSTNKTFALGQWSAAHGQQPYRAVQRCAL